ncbi:MAG: acylneuraminate cytidylyltransferase [Paracoccaceae bacterium]
MAEVAALILARGGSKGVPKKNLRQIGGLSLLARAVRAARGASAVASVWVSTDDAQIAEEAERYGAHVILRPGALSSDRSSSEAGWLHGLAYMQKLGHAVETLVLLQCTSPFTAPGDIDRAVDIHRDTRAGCVLSVLPDHGFLWQRDTGGAVAAVNHDASVPRQRRQDLPPQYRESGAVYVVDAARFQALKRRFIDPVEICVLDHPPIEIDTPDDLALAAAYATRMAQSGPCPDALRRIRAVVMDFDGVHSDDLVHTDQSGRESVTTSRADGLGLGRLRARGRHALLILSKEKNAVVRARAKKLAIPVMSGIDDKEAALRDWLNAQSLEWRDVLFVGNDINDAAVMARAGLSACPSDARPEIAAQASWILPARGGHGALRAMCDRLEEAGL